MTYSLTQANKIDSEIRKLAELYTKTRIKVGLEMAERLRIVKNNKLYATIDEQSYPNFYTYLQSVDIKYSTAMELIGLYEAYVLTAGKTIDELVNIGYHKLTKVKKVLFDRGNKNLIASPSEVDKWLRVAASEITQEDLQQKIDEDRAGKHEHDWQIIKIKKCKICRLKEIAN